MKDFCFNFDFYCFFCLFALLVKVSMINCAPTLKLAVIIYPLLCGRLKVLFLILKVLIVQSMVNKETFVVKVSVRSIVAS